MSSNRLTNDIDLNHKHIINLGCEQDINFKKEIIKVLEEGLKEISERLYSIEFTIENKIDLKK